MSDETDRTEFISLPDHRESYIARSKSRNKRYYRKRKQRQKQSVNGKEKDASLIRPHSQRRSEAMAKYTTMTVLSYWNEMIPEGDKNIGKETMR